MMKFALKIALGVLIIATLLVVTGVVLLNSYENEIKKSIGQHAKQNFGLEIKIEDIRFSIFSTWPHISIQLKGVELNSSLTKGPREPFLKARSIYLAFNLRKLLNKQLSVKQVSIQNASIFMRKRKDGSKNFEFKEQPKDSSVSDGKFKLDVRKISIKNTSFTFINEEKTQRLNFKFVNNTIRMSDFQEGIKAKISGKMEIGGLIFKSRKGAFFKNSKAELELHAVYLKANKTLCVLPPSKVRLNNDYYNAGLLLDIETKSLYIMVNSSSAELAKVARVLNPTIQQVMSNFHMQKPVVANALIGIKLNKKQDPILIINAETKDNTVYIGQSKIPYNKVSFKARIESIAKTMSEGDEDNALIIFPDITGNLYDFPFKAKVAVRGLRNSKINITASMMIEGEKIKQDISKKYVIKGGCYAQLDYSGLASKLNKEHFLDDDMALKATLLFKNLSVRPKASKYVFAVNGTAQLNQQVLSFNKLSFITDGGVAILTGRTENFTNYILGHNNHLKGNLSAHVGNFNLNPYLVKKDNQRTVAVKSKRVTTTRKHRITDDNIDFHIALKAKSLLVKNLKAKNAEILLDYRFGSLFLNSVRMDLCEGKLKAKATIYDLTVLHSQIEIEHVNARQLFEQMDNFGQESLKSENLSGTINLNAKFDSELDEAYNFISPTLKGEVNLRMTDCHLLNFEPMQNLSNYIFKNRDFKDISFSEIKETLFLKGSSLKLEEMEVASNVFNMFVNGVYRFNGSSCINILIPWNNLKRRDKDHVPKVSGETAEDTKGLKLNFSGEAKKMKLNVGNRHVDF